MIYILAGIVGMCALIGVADLIVKIWEKIEARATRRRRRYHHEA